MINMPFLRHFSVSARLLTILVATFCALSAIAGVTYWSEHRLLDAEKQTRQSSDILYHVEKFHAAFAEARLLEAEFFLTPSNALLVRHDETIQHLFEESEIAQKIATETEKKLLEEFSISVQNALIKFSAIAENRRKIGYTETDGHRLLLAQSKKEIIAHQKKLKDPTLSFLFLKMTNYEKDFFLSKKASDYNLLKLEIEALESYINTSLSLRHDPKGLLDSLDTYKRRTADLAEETLKDTNLKAELQNAYAASAPILQALIQEASERNAAALVDKNEIEQTTLYITYMMEFSFSLVLLILCLIISKSISAPLLDLNQKMIKLSSGDTSIDIAPTGRDEISKMEHTLLNFRDKLIETQRLEAITRKQQEKELQRSQKVTQLAQTFSTNVDAVLENVSSASAELNSCSQTMKTLAETSSENAKMASSATHEASTNVQTVSTACEELSASIQEINHSTEQSLSTANQATEEAHKTQNAIAELAEQAKQISDVIGLISGIADQTNLLALNATIEAAHAGELGKGFAIVAGEVKKLSTETASATAKVNSIVSILLEKVDSSVNATANVTSSVSSISSIITGIADAVEQQSAATCEITRNIHDAATGTSLMTETVTEVSTMSTETSNAAEDVFTTSTILADQSAHLQGVIDTFLHDIKTA